MFIWIFQGTYMICVSVAVSRTLHNLCQSRFSSFTLVCTRKALDLLFTALEMLVLLCMIVLFPPFSPQVLCGTLSTWKVRLLNPLYSQAPYPLTQILHIFDFLLCGLPGIINGF